MTGSCRSLPLYSSLKCLSPPLSTWYANVPCFPFTIIVISRAMYSSNLRDVVEGNYCKPHPVRKESSLLPVLVPIPFTTGSYLDVCVQRACGGHTPGIPPSCIVQLCGASGCGKTTVALAAAVHVLADGVVSAAGSQQCRPPHVVWVSSSASTQPFPTSLLLAAVYERLEELGHTDPESIDASHLDKYMSIVVGVQTPGHLLGVLQQLMDLASDPSGCLYMAGRVLVVMDCGAAVLQSTASELIPQRYAGDEELLLGDRSSDAASGSLRKTSYPFVLTEIKRSMRNLLALLHHPECGHPHGGSKEAVLLVTNMCTSTSRGANSASHPTAPFGGPVWRSVPDVSVLMTMVDEEPFLDTVNIEQAFTVVV
jgi:RecA/RadA recombinase